MKNADARNDNKLKSSARNRPRDAEQLSSAPSSLYICARTLPRVFHAWKSLPLDRM